MLHNKKSSAFLWRSAD